MSSCNQSCDDRLTEAPCLSDLAGNVDTPQTQPKALRRGSNGRRGVADVSPAI